jgi:hypothetical protein
MLLNITGSNPIVNCRFGGNHFGKGTLFLKNNTGGTFDPIITFTNENTSAFTFEINPQKLLGLGNALPDLVGCVMGWTVAFVDFDNPSTDPFSFDLTIKQDSNNLTSFSETGSIIDTIETISSTFTII